MPCAGISTSRGQSISGLRAKSPHAGHTDLFESYPVSQRYIGIRRERSTSRPQELSVDKHNAANVNATRSKSAVPGPRSRTILIPPHTLNN